MICDIDIRIVEQTNREIDMWYRVKIVTIDYNNILLQCLKKIAYALFFECD